MPFYVPVGPRGILFRVGMTWTRVLGALTYWTSPHRAQNSPFLAIYPTLNSPQRPLRLRQSNSSITAKIGWRAATAETAAAPLRAILQFDPTGTGKTNGMTDDLAMPDDLGRIRVACANLGADPEITELILASHERDPTKLESMRNTGETLEDYVEHKLAIWEAILDEDSAPPSPGRNSSSDTP